VEEQNITEPGRMKRRTAAKALTEYQENARFDELPKRTKA
jgi:hypothetical protein